MIESYAFKKLDIFSYIILGFIWRQKLKKKAPEQVQDKGEKSKGTNTLLWIIAVALIIVAAVGNTYFAAQLSLVVRVLALVALGAGAVAAAALTNQGQKTIHFIKESRTELRKIIWPTRPEATPNNLNRNCDVCSGFFSVMGYRLYHRSIGRIFNQLIIRH